MKFTKRKKRLIAVFVCFAIEIVLVIAMFLAPTSLKGVFEIAFGAAGLATVFAFAALFWKGDDSGFFE